MPHLVAAPDKFRGTATAAQVAAAAGRAAREVGWTVDEVPLADGGEGTLDALGRALGGEVRRTVVRGPLGRAVEAEWRFFSDPCPWIPFPPIPSGPFAVIEAARAGGRALLPHPQGDDPVRASTEGVGELVLAAVDAGARLVIVAVGGSASTDGGWGAVSAIGDRARLAGVRLLVACDVTTPFREAAQTYGPQKGASPAQVAELRRRLDRLARRYGTDYGVDVDALVGAGAAGGLAGGLAALGGDLVPGFSLVSATVGLDRRLAPADLVVTGEGRLDATSFDGKVVGALMDAGGGTVPLLCIAGEVEPGTEAHWERRPGPVEVVDLAASVGLDRAMSDPAGAVADIVAARCTTWLGSGRETARAPDGLPASR